MSCICIETFTCNCISIYAYFPNTFIQSCRNKTNPYWCKTDVMAMFTSSTDLMLLCIHTYIHTHAYIYRYIIYLYIHICVHMCTFALSLCCYMHMHNTYASIHPLFPLVGWPGGIPMHRTDIAHICKWYKGKSNDRSKSHHNRQNDIWPAILVF